jgi:hypothetical protein
VRKFFVLVVLAPLVFGAPAVWAFAHHAARWMDHPTSGPTPARHVPANHLPALPIPGPDVRQAPAQIVTNRVAAYGRYVGPTS